MEFILLLSILSFALALPNKDAPVRQPYCIKMTPEKEQQIDQIVEKLGQFLNNLSIEHEHFDFRLIKLSIEQHTENEEEKETELQLSVNDCQLTDDELGEIDDHRDKTKEHEKEREEKERDAREAGLEKEKGSYEKPHKKEDSMKKEQDEEEKSHAHEKHPETEKEKIKPDSDVNPEAKVTEDELKQKQEENLCDDKPEANGQREQKLNDNGKKVKPELIYLDLDEKEQRLLEALGRKKGPIVVYIQKMSSGQTAHWFLKRR